MKNILILLTIIALFIFLPALYLNKILFKKELKTASDSPKTCAAKIACPDCNLILLSVDSLRADHVGAYGYKRNTTPNLDKFAKQSITFNNYFTTAFLTPISEMSLQTGMYPSSNGVTGFDTVLPENKHTLAQIMKKEGYKTSALLSSPEFDEAHPALKESFSRGFDSYKYVSAKLSRDLPSSAEIKGELDSFGSDKFFFWLPIGRVHWPYGQDSPNLYGDPKYNGIFKDKDLWWPLFKRIYKDKIYPKNTSLNKDDIQYIKNIYDNGIRNFDDFFGKLISEIKRRGVLDKTIIVIESEHGEDLGEHGYFAHYDVMDTQIHTPLIIFSPKVKKPLSINALSSSVDVLPTINELLGRIPSKQVQGKSLVPLICGEEKTNNRKGVFIERNPLWEESVKTVSKELKIHNIDVGNELHKDIAIRTKEWKYILRTSKSALEKISWWQFISGKKINFPEAELYNLIEDPMEVNNVIDKFPDIAKEFKSKVDKFTSLLEKSTPQEVKHIIDVQPYF